MSQPPSYRLRPLGALRAMRNLLRDREDTHQVFLLIDALRGKTTLRQFARFRQTETGRAVLGEHRRLLDRLSDRASLAALPAGTLGRAYYDFTASENLSVEGLVEASQITMRALPADDVTLFRERSREMHDLLHVLTGYGRDPLHGRSAGWLPGADWEALLAQPVEAIRAQFAVKSPTYYRTILVAVRRLRDDTSAGYDDPSIQLSS